MRKRASRSQGRAPQGAALDTPEHHAMKARLSTHVLDIARGVPAAGVAIELCRIEDDVRTVVVRAVTNNDGRTDAPLATALPAGIYELVFGVGPYFARTGTPSLYDAIPVRFRVDEGGRYHIPLLLSPWGYSTYRGS
jgi:5-hydroxyisourate hydrolase